MARTRTGYMLNTTVVGVRMHKRQRQRLEEIARAENIAASTLLRREVERLIRERPASYQTAPEPERAVA